MMCLGQACTTTQKPVVPTEEQHTALTMQHIQPALLQCLFKTQIGADAIDTLGLD